MNLDGRKRTIRDEVGRSSLKHMIIKIAVSWRRLRISNCVLAGVFITSNSYFMPSFISIGSGRYLYAYRPQRNTPDHSRAIHLTRANHKSPKYQAIQNYGTFCRFKLGWQFLRRRWKWLISSVSCEINTRPLLIDSGSMTERTGYHFHYTSRSGCVTCVTSSCVTSSSACWRHHWIVASYLLGYITSCCFVHLGNT